MITYYKSLITHEDIVLDIYEYNGNKNELWNTFKPYHYLSSDLNMASVIYVCYWNEILVGMCAVLPIPSGNIKHAFRPTRTVILPDYQGLGIGTRFSECIANIYLEKGYKFYYRTSHLRLRGYFDNSPYWIATSHNDKKADANKNFDNTHASINRVCGAYEYMGREYANLPHIDIRIDYTDKCNLEIIKADLGYLKQNYYITVITGNVKEDNPIDLICQELGIRTQLLYYRGKISGQHKDKKIITEWDSNFSKEIREYFK